MKYILHYNYSTLDNDTNYTNTKEFLSMTTLEAFIKVSEAPSKIYNYKIEELED